MKNILVVDGFNLFIRNFSVNSAFNYRGQHIGGIVGSLIQLRNMVDILKIDHVIFIFDGDQSRSKRQKLYPQYKANRLKAPIKCRVPKQLKGLQIDHSQSMVRQLIIFQDVLQSLPCRILMIPRTEGDDVIYYVTKLFKEKNKVFIASNDKDFIQLLDENVVI